MTEAVLKIILFLLEIASFKAAAGLSDIWVSDYLGDVSIALHLGMAVRIRRKK